MLFQLSSLYCLASAARIMAAMVLPSSFLLNSRPLIDVLFAVSLIVVMVLLLWLYFSLDECVSGGLTPCDPSFNDVPNASWLDVVHICIV
jgi:hypothetical protein